MVFLGRITIHPCFWFPSSDAMTKFTTALAASNNHVQLSEFAFVEFSPEHILVKTPPPDTPIVGNPVSQPDPGYGWFQIMVRVVCELDNSDISPISGTVSPSCPKIFKCIEDVYTLVTN